MADKPITKEGGVSDYTGLHYRMKDTGQHDDFPEFAYYRYFGLLPASSVLLTRSIFLGVSFVIFVMDLIWSIENGKIYLAYTNNWSMISIWTLFLFLVICSAELRVIPKWFLTLIEAWQFWTVTLASTTMLFYGIFLFKEWDDESNYDIFLDIVGNFIVPALPIIEFILNRVPVRKLWFLTNIGILCLYMLVHYLIVHFTEKPIYDIEGGWKYLLYGSSFIAANVAFGLICFVIRTFQKPIKFYESLLRDCGHV